MDAADLDTLGATLLRDGVIVVRGLASADACDAVVQGWLAEGAPFAGPLRRAVTGDDSPHRRSADGLVTNPVVNAFQLPERQFPTFRTLERTLMEGSHVVPLARAALGPPAMLQSAFYESSPGTGAHVDFNPLGDHEPMIAAWIALEDIHPAASRLFVVPGSHTATGPARDAFVAWSYRMWEDLYVSRGAPAPDLLARSDAMLAALLDATGLQRAVPDLRKGDAVLWTNHVVHGSTPPREPGRSRRSVVFHFVRHAAVASPTNDGVSATPSG